jgi:PrtD family type I secretion system ABC transporter
MGGGVLSKNASPTLFQNFSLLRAVDRRSLLWISIASVSNGVLLFSVPLYSIQIFDRVLTSRSLDTLLLLTGIVIVTLLSAAVLDVMRTRVLVRMANQYVARRGRALFDATLNESSRRAEPSNQPLRDLHTVHQFLATPPGLIIFIDSPFALIFLISVFLLHPQLGYLLVLGMAMLLVLTLAGELITARHFRANSESSILAQRFSDGAMVNAEIVDSMGMGSAIYSYWKNLLDSALVKFSKAGDRSAIVAAMARWARLLLTVLSTAVGAWLVIEDELTIGAMVAANILAARALSPLESVIASWKSLVAATVAHERIEAVLQQCARTDSGIGLPAPRGLLSIERLVYRPPGAEHPTIKGVSFQVQPGSLVGLVGPSGAGKSTLAKLICGVWKPTSGSVRLDGADIYTWPRTDWGLHCGYLPQEVELFAGTVRENIARFRDAEDFEVIDAAIAAGAHELILRLPSGYDTQIGYNGAVLSGGYRQRIALARALFGQPKLIVLDEPNANLDAEGEEALKQAMQRIREAGSTIVVVSHRQSLLVAADFLAVVIEGQLRHYGPRNEVLRQLQSVGKAKGDVSEQ